MSWRKGGRDGRGYHHGNLREALISAALDLIGQKGPAGVTFAEAARMAGVSTAAPYRHFRDREALLADVARQGFEKLSAVLENAWDGGRPNATRAFERTGRAYLGFAREEPAYFASMFESGIPLGSNPQLQASADRAFSVLREAAEAAAAGAPEGRRPPALMVALHIWAMTHGIAALFGRADGPLRTIPMPPEELLEAGLLVYLQGLGLGPDS
ncbi:MAG: TetR/AcrR family transcriptional regulator [Hyphomicrobiaceae bacterium]